MAESVQVNILKPNPSTHVTATELLQLHISSDPDDFLGQGLYGTVSRVKVHVGNKLLHFAYKVIKSEGVAVSELKKWMQLKAAKVPVIPTFRLVEHEGKYTGVLMTDVTNNWQDIFITSNETKSIVLKQVLKNTPETVRKFAALNLDDIATAEHIEKQIQRIAERTARNNIALQAGDVVGVVFTNSGNIRLCIADTDNVQLNATDGYEILLAKNMKSAVFAMAFIKDAQRIAKDMVRV